MTECMVRHRRAPCGMALVRWLCHCGLLRTRPPSVLRMGAAARGLRQNAVPPQPVPAQQACTGPPPACAPGRQHTMPRHMQHLPRHPFPMD